MFVEKNEKCTSVQVVRSRSKIYLWVCDAYARYLTTSLINALNFKIAGEDQNKTAQRAECEG